MPSALETLVKILKLEQNTGYNNTAVIGGLESFGEKWQIDAHQQARRPEHHQLVDELVGCLMKYGREEEAEARHEAVKYMLGRIMGRIPAPPDLPPSSYVDDETEDPASDTPVPQTAYRETHDDDSGADLGDDDARDDAGDGESFSEDETFDDDADEEEFFSSAPEPERAAPAPRGPSKARRSPRPVRSPEEALASFEALAAPITDLARVGDKMAEKLQRLDIATVRDLLFSFPRRYDDYTQMRTINRLRPGETVTVVGSVRSVTKRQGRRGNPYLLALVDDGTATLQVAFFGQPWLERQFKRDRQIVLSGDVDMFRGQLMMTNPEWELLERDNLHTGRIVPVYPLTKGITARTMRRISRTALDQWADRIPDPLPTSVLDRTQLADLSWALEQVHFPESQENLRYARTRLMFDDLFIFQTAMLRNRHTWQAVPGQPIHVPDEWVQTMLDTLPYQLTSAQERALGNIRDDLARDVPMNRLIQGDVGSGKTVVAAVAMAMTVEAGMQAALMAPTSILAEQHARSISALLHNSPLGEATQVRLLMGNTGEAERQEIYAGLADGSIQVVIGTHALIQAGVTFARLGLAIIDEQHRFGVEQRGTLRGKGYNPHVLVMTATPIPRTLALTLYADLDLTIIDEMPPGRTPVATRVIEPVERERAYAFIRTQLDQGRQAFVVYPLVEASESLDEVGSAVEAYEHLQAEEFGHYRVGLLHGRMPPAEKDTTMQAFAAGEIDVLVSTSVVEVGIDVPNASVILIENADRFGLAQLHQFRGRVGRGEHPSYCLLVSSSATKETNERLKAMEETSDGFRLAEIDWRLRGPGDLLGVRQSGAGHFRLTEMMDPQLVELAQREARTIYAEDPGLSLPDHVLLARRVQAFLDERADIS